MEWSMHNVEIRQFYYQTLYIFFKWNDKEKFVKSKYGDLFSIWYTSPSGRVSIKYSPEWGSKLLPREAEKVKNTFPSGRRPQGKVFLWPWRPQGEVILTLTRESILYLPNRLVRYSILILFISGLKLREINLFSTKL